MPPLVVSVTVVASVGETTRSQYVPEHLNTPKETFNSLSVFTLVLMLMYVCYNIQYMYMYISLLPQDRDHIYVAISVIFIT